MLPRGEQRAMILLTMLLILSLIIRTSVELLPGREPAGLEEFTSESLALLEALALSRNEAALSRQNVGSDPITGRRPYITERSSLSRSTAALSRSTAALSRSEAAISRSTAAISRSAAARSLSTAAIDLNTADSAQLLPLPGIGPVYAGRIIKYRNLLGGFVKKEQLLEVYGLPAETVDLIRDRVDIDTTAIWKIEVDSASFGELLRHPYLEIKEVKLLLNYRDFAGNLSSMQELIENNVMPDSIARRLGGYFDFGE